MIPVTLATAGRWPHRVHIVSPGNPGRGRTFTRCGQHLAPRAVAEMASGPQLAPNITCRHCLRMLRPEEVEP